MAVGDVQVLFADVVTRSNFHDAISSNISINDGMVFNGTNSYAYIPNFDLSDTKQITFSFWIYPTARTLCCICEHSANSSANNAFFVNFESGSAADKVKFAIRDHESTTNWYNIFKTIKEYPINNWYHVAITKDRTQEGREQTKIWVNGTQDYAIYSNYYNTLTSYFENNTLYIGTRGNVAYFLYGRLCNFLIYKRILNEREIKDLYNSGRTSYAVVTDGLYVEYSGRDFEGSSSSPTLIYDTRSITRAMFQPKIITQVLRELRTNANTKYLAAEINGKIMFAGIEEAA